MRARTAIAPPCVVLATKDTLGTIETELGRPRSPEAHSSVTATALAGRPGPRHERTLATLFEISRAFVARSNPERTLKF